jgi:hypothetical protein
MEMWSSVEMAGMEGTKYPRKLYNETSFVSEKKNVYTEIQRALKELEVDDDPRFLNRVDLFGKQARFEFTNDDDLILKGLAGIKISLNSLEHLDPDVLTFGPGDKEERVSGRIVQLHYDARMDTFYLRYASVFIFKLVLKIFRRIEKERFKDFVNRVRGQFHPFYPSIFEQYVNLKIGDGSQFYVRDFDDISGVFKDRIGPCISSEFYHTHRLPVLFYEDEKGTRLLGTQRISEATLFMQMNQRCPTIDSIVVVPPHETTSGRGRVDFVQTATRVPDRKINPASFFAMLLLVVRVKHMWKTDDVDVRFVFVVEYEDFRDFTPSGVGQIRALFPSGRLLVSLTPTDDRPNPPLVTVSTGITITPAKIINTRNSRAIVAKSTKTGKCRDSCIKIVNDTVGNTTDGVSTSTELDNVINSTSTPDNVYYEIVEEYLCLNMEGFYNYCFDFSWGDMHCSVNNRNVMVKRRNINSELKPGSTCCCTIYYPECINKSDIRNLMVNLFQNARKVEESKKQKKPNFNALNVYLEKNKQERLNDIFEKVSECFGFKDVDENRTANFDDYNEESLCEWEL